MDAWNDGKRPTTKSSYARLMAICALSGYRIDHGTNTAPSNIAKRINPGLYLEHALEATRTDAATPRDIRYHQAIGLICMTAMEVGNAFLVQRYLGIYHAAVAEQGLSDERRWPSDMCPIERDERRRLYWHMYRLEVHMAMVMGHVVRCPELQSLVAYPQSEEDDSAPGDFEWLSGWNFVTDLYRGLEHLLAKLRLRLLSNPQLRPHSVLSTTFLTDYDHEKDILAPLTSTYKSLPERFKTAAPLSPSNINANRCGYQTANIVCTYLLLKMVSYSWSCATFKQACDTALELVDQITSIPIEYLKSMSLGMVQELSGFGYILSNFVGKDLPESGYQDLKNAMLCMAEFLESLKSNMIHAKRASAQLREYVSKIDQLLADVRTTANETPAAQISSEVATNQVSYSLDPDIGSLLGYTSGLPWPDDWIFASQDTFHFTSDISDKCQS